MMVNSVLQEISFFYQIIRHLIAYILTESLPNLTRAKAVNPGGPQATKAPLA